MALPRAYPAGGVANPMTSDLDGGDQSMTNVKDLVIGASGAPSSANYLLEVSTTASLTGARIGYAYIGNYNSPNQDWAMFAHHSQANQSNYALLQDDFGFTQLNANGSRRITISIGNNVKGAIDSSGWAMGAVTSGDASALLDMVSTSQGLLPPRMTTTQRDAISSPATGLLIWNTTTGQLEDYNGTAWAAV